MHNFNMELFTLINAGPNLAGVPLHLAIILAKYVVYLIPLWLIALWFWGSPKYRSAILFAIASTSVAIIINKIIGFIWFQPRPFMIGLGHQYLAHRPNESFPSDHTTFLWAIGFSLLLQAGLRLQGSIILVLALAVGWARVFLGIHFPADIIGGIFTATFAVLVVDALRPWINAKILPLVEAIYRKIFAKLIAKKIIQA